MLHQIAGNDANSLAVGKCIAYYFMICHDYLIIALLVYCTVVVISLLCREAPLQKLVSSLYYSNSESVNSGANLAGLQESALPSAAQGNHPVVQAENIWPWLFCYLRIHCVKPKRYKKTWSSQRVWTMDSIHLGSNPTMLAWVVWHASTFAHPGASKAVSFTSPKSAQTSAPMV